MARRRCRPNRCRPASLRTAGGRSRPVDRVKAVDLDQEGGLQFSAASVVPVGPHAGTADLLDLVLAGAVQDERVFEAQRKEGLAITGRPALGARQRVVVEVTERDHIAADPTAGRADNRLIRIRHHDRVFSANPDARPSRTTSVAHQLNSDTAASSAAAAPRPRSLESRAAVRRRHSPKKRRPEAPAQIGASGWRGGRKEPFEGASRRYATARAFRVESASG